jgi:hypothetical protein
MVTDAVRRDEKWINRVVEKHYPAAIRSLWGSPPLLALVSIKSAKSQYHCVGVDVEACCSLGVTLVLLCKMPFKSLMHSFACRT